jgi:carbon-monoxide dehydrogenase medium subunit
MIPAPFDYHKPANLQEACSLLRAKGGNAKILAGGHSLIPAMKLRLAQPSDLIDLSRVGGLSYIRELDNRVAVGAMTTHYLIEASLLLAKRSPLLPAVAGQIGDVQVRNRGTIGGSLVHADPAADWPATILALDAELDVLGPDGSRVIPADKFFTGLFSTALQPDEIVREIRVAATAPTIAYVKTFQQASGFAIAGSAVVVDARAKTVRVAINGVAASAYRATAVERALAGRPLAPANIAEAAALAGEGVEGLSDIHASARYRLHLACVNTRRALESAAIRA